MKDSKGTEIVTGMTVASTYTVWTGTVTKLFSKNGKDMVRFVTPAGATKNYESKTLVIV